jgi:hypothetical protein
MFTTGLSATTTFGRTLNRQYARINANPGGLQPSTSSSQIHQVGSYKYQKIHFFKQKYISRKQKHRNIENTFHQNTNIENTFHGNTNIENTFHGNTNIENTFHGNANIENTFHENTNIENTFHENTNIENTFHGNTNIENTFHENTNIENTFHENTNIVTKMPKKSSSHSDCQSF